ncbi:hypothetical protein HK102_013005, partial [Quaeritorhiza haematococci]
MGGSPPSGSPCVCGGKYLATSPSESPRQQHVSSSPDHHSIRYGGGGIGGSGRIGGSGGVGGPVL